MNYKVYVKDENTNKKVQEHAFKLEYGWPSTGTNIIQFISMHFLFFDEAKTIRYRDEFDYFKNFYAVELTPEEFMALPVLTLTDVTKACSKHSCYYYNVDHNICGKTIFCHAQTNVYVCPTCHCITFNSSKGVCNFCGFIYPTLLPKKEEKEFDLKTMTETEAYRIAAEMWYFLARNPDLQKKDWPDYKKYKLDTSVVECTLCIFHKEEHRLKCMECYLYEKRACYNEPDMSLPYWVWKKKKIQKVEKLQHMKFTVIYKINIINL